MAEQWRTGADGLLECVDTETGRILHKETKNPSKVTKNGKRVGRKPGYEAQTFQKVRNDAGEVVYVPTGTNPDKLPKLQNRFPYSRVTCENILKLIREGKTISEIGAMEGFPSQETIWDWAQKHQDFDAEIKVARSLKAHMAFDKIVHMANEEGFFEKEVPGKRLLFDMLKHISQVALPEQYTPKTKIISEGTPVQFVINTGIVREPKEVKSEDSSD